MRAAFIKPLPAPVKRSGRELGPRKDNSRLHNRDLQNRSSERVAGGLSDLLRRHCFTFSAAVLVSYQSFLFEDITYEKLKRYETAKDETEK